MAARRLPNRALDEENEPQGDVIDGQLASPGEVDAERVDRDNDDDVLRALAALDASGEVTWQVNRTIPADQAGYLFDLSTPELTLANIKKRAGPGKYKIKGFRTNGQYAGQRTILIARELEPAPGTAMMLSPQMPTFSEQMQLLERSKLAQKEELKFWLGLLLPIFGPAIVQMFTKRDSIAELVGALKGLQGMTQPQNSISELEKLKKLQEILKDMAGDKESVGSTWPDIVRDGITQLGPLLSTLAQRQQAGATGPQPQPRPVPAVDMRASPLPQDQPAQPAAQNGDPMYSLVQWLNQSLPYLIQKAAQNADAELYADWLIDNLPPNQDAKVLHGFLSREDWFAMLLNFSPDVRPYQGWFTTLRDALLESIENLAPEVRGKT